MIALALLNVYTHMYYCVILVVVLVAHGTLDEAGAHAAL